ncbi:uncharacterized protein LOC124639129 isoform X2 [Helicoverpa zea]|uniref:uncharacterized protein LOC124639129 isoform X2 n=1 Tax=Helicoverpa zea TaxID=7113 RepID=UPI001F57BC07|nr:uncharacterized protein LOC124639129 isoform X2 [Helicoverpa zea]XP_047032336.1 uncharacterized protein LOC124639129 isoform X2 [Helicoverpa zea]
MSNVEKNGIAKEKRKIVRSEARKIVAKVYHFLKEEFEFTELHKEPNCDISHLRNITMRTAAATKVSVRTVQQILKEEREAANKPSNLISPKPNQRKKGKIKENIETDPEEDSSESTEQNIS